ncbi:transporter substrate-binding domain-containing protein, partial [Micrococcus sp. SIMBA_131]
QAVLLCSRRDDDRFEVGGARPTGEQLGMAVGPQKAQLGSAVNRAPQELRNDGTVAELQERWFGHAQEDYR